MPNPETLAILAALETFARQRPGINPRDYGDTPEGVRIYRADARAASRDLRAVRELSRALAMIGTEPDAILRNATERDRLTITRDGDLARITRIEYTAGQNYPTEYRAAVARTLAAALHAATFSDDTIGDQAARAAAFRRRLASLSPTARAFSAFA